MENHLKNKKTHIKVLTIIAIAAFLSIGIFECWTKEVTICIDDKKETIRTREATVKDLLEKEGIILEKGGYINLNPETKIKDNLTIILKRPKTYSIKIGDRKIEVESPNNKVADILKDVDIKLDDNDYTYPRLGETVNPMDEIEIVKVDEKIEVVKEEIPFEKITKNTDKLEIGNTKVAQEGKNGLKEIQVKKIFENGKLVKEKVLADNVVTLPVPKIIEKGTKNFFVSSRGLTKYKRNFVVVATAYDLSYASCGKNPGDKHYGLTALGTKARPGVVSVDPSVIPLGTKLYIQSLDGKKDYGFAIAEDTGNAIKGNRIDLFFSSHEAAMAFGRRKVKIYILED